MLCITRSVDEKLIISDRATGAVLATVLVVGISPRGPKVKLGVEAEQSICIDRPEIYQNRRDEAEQAAAEAAEQAKAAAAAVGGGR